MDLEKARKALTERVISLPGVAGVGVGSKGGKPCLKVFVERRGLERSRRIPRFVMGIPVVVEKSGMLRGGG